MKLLLILLFVSGPAMGAPWRLLEPREVYIDIHRYHVIQDPYLNPVDRNLLYGADFHLGINLLTIKNHTLYWDNDLFFDQSKQDGRIKTGGWRYRVAFEIIKSKLEVFWAHESRHIFEDTRQQHFPNYFRGGIRLIIVPKE